MTKKIVLSVLVVLFILFGVIFRSLYLMEIEDHYGDLQEAYFESKDGDIIINKETKQYGIITKNWKRANVITKENDTLDLYNFIYRNEKRNSYEVLRSENELKVNSFTFEKISELKKDKLMKTIIEN